MYDADDNARQSYDVAISSLRERLEKSKVVIGDCVLYCEKAEFIVPTLAKVDAYGDDDWDDEPVDPSLMDAIRAKAKWQIIFGGNYYALPPTSCWLIWDKLNGNSDFADCELAWTNLPGAVRRLRFMWNGMLRRERHISREHPTQKPVGVMTWCMEHLPADAQTILDPFMGSGTTLVAAVKLGKRAIGIEKDPKYFEIACRRVEQAYAQGDLFVSAPSAKAKQLDLEDSLSGTQ